MLAPPPQLPSSTSTSSASTYPNGSTQCINPITNTIERQPHAASLEMTEEEKEALRERARRFAAELEECMYELYSEPDKTGKHGVAAKYK